MPMSSFFPSLFAPTQRGKRLFVFLALGVYCADGAARLPWDWRERGECLERDGFGEGSLPSDLLSRLEQMKGRVFPRPAHSRAADVNTEHEIPPEPTAFL